LVVEIISNAGSIPVLPTKIVIMKKYTKYVDDKGDYYYELELENGSKFMVPKELGDYVYKLEKKVKK